VKADRCRSLPPRNGAPSVVASVAARLDECGVQHVDGSLLGSPPSRQCIRQLTRARISVAGMIGLRTHFCLPSRSAAKSSLIPQEARINTAPRGMPLAKRGKLISSICHRTLLIGLPSAGVSTFPSASPHNRRNAPRTLVHPILGKFVLV